MIVHIMPLYKCNLNCSYCYLGSLKNSNQILDLKILKEKLSKLHNISCINIYGGEITLLSRQYIEDLVSTCNFFCSSVNITTNMYDISKLNNLDIGIATSLNPERADFKQNRLRLLCLDKKICITVVVTPAVQKEGAKKILQRLSLYKMPVTFLQYFPSKENHIWKISNKEYENFMIDIIKEYKTGKYNFIIHNIEELSKRTSPLMLSHIFINPNGNYCSTIYSNGYESFKEWQSLNEYYVAAEKEKIQYKKLCNACEFFNNCYAEHLHFEKEEDTCCGMYRLCDTFESLYKNN